MKILIKYRRLESVYGSKKHVADLLGYTLRHYDDLRIGKAVTPKAVELALDKLITDSKQT